MSTQKPDCYKCEYRRDLPGDCHSSCNHPAFKSAHADPMANIMAIFGSVGRMPAVQHTSEKCVVKGHPHGIRSGWFMHPMNFDPVWLQECSGFKARDAALGESTKEK